MSQQQTKPHSLPVKRIIGLLSVFLLAIASILAIDVIFQHLTQTLNEQLNNERSRVLIGESIIQDIHRTELNIYQMATSSGNFAYKPYEHKIEQNISHIHQKLNVLKEGGEVTRTIFLNIEEADEIQQKIIFRHPEGDNAYLLVQLEVTPQLEQVVRKVQLLKEMLAQAGQVSDPERRLEQAAQLKNFIKQFPPLFFRLYENIGRLHYEAQKNSERLAADLSEKISIYALLKQWLVVIIILFVLSFGYVFIRRVVRSNQQLEQTWQDMEQAKRYAEQANLAKSQFLSNMSHELRTPLNAIIGFAQLLNMEEMLPTQKQPIDHINKAALHLLEMVNQILDLSKIEAGMLQLSIETFSLHRLIDDTCQLLSRSIENKGVMFHCHREQDVPNFVKGDELRIRQVLLNLLANATKFTHHGSISLSISTTNDPDVMYFEVEDTGIGMNEATLQKLFHAFTQADISTSKQYGGTGLGLSLSKELVELMGGAMGVHSVLHEGSKFWFTLKLPRTENMHNTPAPDTSLRLEDPAFAMLRVLLVEDNPVNQMVASKMLKKFGIVPVVANHGEEALAQLAQANYHLAFLDVQMPVMDGYETITHIREGERISHDGKHLYVIGLSANALNEDKAKAIDLGMDDYLTKPINFGDLQHKLERALLHIRQIEALEEQIKFERGLSNQRR